MHRARLLRHGHASRLNGTVRHTPEFQSWTSMRKRCFDKNDAAYAHYGARGITVCDKWRDDFSAFFRDMGHRPDGTSLDRFPDGAGDYEPGNCRWATRKEQANNTSSNRRMTYRGEQLTIAEIADVSGVNPSTLRTRLNRGWTLEDAVAGHRMSLKNK
jgi:hypothetical protein